jgi:glycosyltransferase A (GT-A) superfamily protein (DUF2064 family)
MNNPNILLFSKVPEFAACKTRLLASSSLSQESVQQLAVAMLLDTISVASSLSTSPKLFWAIEPNLSQDALANHFLNFDSSYNIELKQWNLFSQRGQNFEQKIEHALLDAYKIDNSGIMVIGSDAPCLSSKQLEKASYLLSKEKCVLGPTPEGGVYLIGFPKSLLAKLPSLEGIFSATEITELEKLRNFCSDLGFEVALLEMQFDVDIAQDLITLTSIISCLKTPQDSYGSASYTTQLLKKLNLSFQRDKDNNRVLKTA